MVFSPNDRTALEARQEHDLRSTRITSETAVMRRADIARLMSRAPERTHEPLLRVTQKSRDAHNARFNRMFDQGEITWVDDVPVVS